METQGRKVVLMIADLKERRAEIENDILLEQNSPTPTKERRLHNIRELGKSSKRVRDAIDALSNLELQDARD